MRIFLFKLLLDGIIVVPLLAWLTDASWSGAVAATVILCIVSYLIGDQIILRYTNNLIASIVDVVITYLVLWLAVFYVGWDATNGLLLTISLSVGVMEYFLHWFMLGDFKKAEV